jgi:hypothetical protein
MPWPRSDLDKQYTRQSFDFVTGSGQHAVSLLSGGSRTYTLHWSALHIDNYSLLDAYWGGVNGNGPWALIDPSVPNLLLPNQAGMGSASYDTVGLKTTGSTLAEGSISTNATASFIHRTNSLRSIRWQFTTAAASFPLLGMTPAYRNWPGTPVVVGLPYTWSLWTRADGVVDSSITMAAKIRWLDITGAQLSETTSGDIVVGTTFTKLTASATAPANAAYAYVFLLATGSTITTGGSIYADEALFEQDSVANSWAPGVGVRAVEILSLSDSVTFETRMRKGVDLSLQELAI